MEDSFVVANSSTVQDGLREWVGASREEEGDCEGMELGKFDVAKDR